MLKYETNLNLSDKHPLAKEADDVWDLFRLDVERAGFTSAIISANVKPSGGFIHANQSYNFVFEKDAQGQWRSSNLISTPAKVAYRQALKLFVQGRYKDAITEYSKAVSLDPAHAQAYVDRGGVYLLLNQPDKALSDLNKGISLNPDSVEAYLNRGGAYGELKQYQKAIDDLTKAISLNANPAVTAGAYTNRGECYLSMGQYQKAIDDLTKAIGAHPQLAEAYYYRSMAYEKVGQKDLAGQDRITAKQLGYKEGADTAVIEGSLNNPRTSAH